MINIILKLFKYIIFISLPCCNTAVLSQSFGNLTAPAESNLKNIDEVIKCNECCTYYKDTKACDIFYNLCMTRAFKDGVFMFTKDKLFLDDESKSGESRIIHRIKKYRGTTKEKNIIFIFINKRIFFCAEKYMFFRVEVNANIEKIENKYKQLSDDDSFKKNKKDIDTRSKLATSKQRKNKDEDKKKNPMLYFFVVNYTNIDFIVNKYTSILGQDKEKIIKLYNKDRKELCINKLKPTNVIALKTTFPTNSIVTDKSLFIDRGTTYYKKLEKDLVDLPIIGITVAIAAVAVAIVAVASFFIYKKYNRLKPDTGTKSEINNKNEIAKSIEHIYEEPIFNYKTADLIVDDKKHNRSSTMLSQSKEHVYIPCINNSYSEASNDTSIKINNLDSNNNLHEQ